MPNYSEDFWSDMRQSKPEPAAPNRKRRVFLWVFVSVNIFFLVMVFAGAMSGNGQPADCGTLDAETCNTASDAGTAIGVGLLIGLWFFVDLFLGLVYAVVALARRSS